MNQELVNILSRNLRLLKAKYGLTQKEMADICDMGVGSVAKLLKNQIPKRMSLRCVFKLAEHFGFDVGMIFSKDFINTVIMNNNCK